MHSSRVKLLLGALLAVFLLFTFVNAHGDHGHGRHPVHDDDLDDDEPVPSSSAAPESTSAKTVELPTFTVHIPPNFICDFLADFVVAHDHEGRFY